MVAPAFDCNRNRLKHLLDDSLSNEQQAAVVAHLDFCGTCQKTLELLAADEVWWQRLRNLADDDGPAQPPSSPLRKQPNSATTVTAQRTLLEDDGLSLDFLDASKNPAHLGRLEPFEITEVLGRGGMGIVLKGIDGALNRPVAIKVLAPHFASSGAARKRFAREAQAAAAVVHDHVVPIHSVGAWKGLPYLVMSYVPGRSLQELIDAEGPLDAKEVLRIGRQMALGLAAAHAQGLVHRDVKPANILLENGVNRVRISDFGLARAIDDASLTQSGVITGTPQYMSPEQSRSEVVDHRSDLFSFGSTLYAMCTGHPPFRSDSPMTVLLRIRDEQPRPIRAVNPDVPEWLAAIIDTLHAKAPERRFQSAAEVADLLEQCLAHVQEPGTNKLPTVLANRRRNASRAVSRRIVAALVLAIIAVVAVAGMSWHFFGDRAREQFGQVADDSENSMAKTNDAISAASTGELLQPMNVDEIRLQAERIEAEMHQPVRPDVSNDIGLVLINEARRKLDALERELSPSKE